MKPKTFDLFTLEEINGRIANYRDSSKFLDSDIEYLTKNRIKIGQLFNRPEVFKDGHEFKAKLQRLIEFYYLRSIETNNQTVQTSLTDLLYTFYKTVDSLILQEAIIFSIEHAAKPDIDQAQYEILKFFYVFNSISLKDNYDGDNIIHRINNQRRILNYFLAYDRKQLETLHISGDIQTQMMKRAYIETLKIVDEKYYSHILSDVERQLVKISLKSSWSMPIFFEDIKEYNIPHIEYLYIQSFNNDKKALYKYVENKELSIEARLYVLLKICSQRYNVFGSIEDSINRMSEALDKNRGISISAELEDELRNSVEDMLSNISNRNLSTGDNYLDSLEAEMLFTAAAVSLHEKYPKINLIDFLKQLQFTFVRDNRTEFIVKYSGSNESEYVSIAMDDKKEYIDSIKDFVESVYKKNIGEKTDRNDAKFKPVAKGPSALITIFKKSLYVFIIMFSFNVLYLNNKVDAMAYPYSVEQTIMTKVDFKSLMDVTNIPDAVFAGGNSAVEFLKRTPACYNSGVQSCF